jgi:transcriptional antiterminator
VSKTPIIEKILTLIRSSALLHQYQRKENEDGFIIASKEDYEIVYSLRELLSQTVSSLSEPVKKFLIMIKSSEKEEGDFINREDLRKKLKVSPATIKRYVKTSLESDYIEAIGKGQKQLLRLIEIPDMISPLPEPEKIFGDACDPMSQTAEEFEYIDKKQLTEA